MMSSLFLRPSRVLQKRKNNVDVLLLRVRHSVRPRSISFCISNHRLGYRYDRFAKLMGTRETRDRKREGGREGGRERDPESDSINIGTTSFRASWSNTQKGTGNGHLFNPRQGGLWHIRLLKRANLLPGGISHPPFS
jgi:hypothetical protein